MKPARQSYPARSVLQACPPAHPPAPVPDTDRPGSQTLFVPVLQAASIEAARAHVRNRIRGRYIRGMVACARADQRPVGAPHTRPVGACDWLRRSRLATEHEVVIERLFAFEGRANSGPPCESPRGSLVVAEEPVAPVLGAAETLL